MTLPYKRAMSLFPSDLAFLSLQITHCFPFLLSFLSTKLTADQKECYSPNPFILLLTPLVGGVQFNSPIIFPTHLSNQLQSSPYLLEPHSSYNLCAPHLLLCTLIIFISNTAISFLFFSIFFFLLGWFHSEFSQLKKQQSTMKMGLGLVPLLILSLLVSVCSAEISGKVGVNYGQLGNNLPSPSRSVELIKSLKAKRVKIYNANPEILESLRNTNLKVSIMVPNQLISNISSNQTVADQWVRSNVVPFYPHTMIRYLLVGNEILSSYSDTQSWDDIVPAMRKIKNSLRAQGIRKVKVGTPSAMDVLESSFPPSNGTFRSEIAVRVVKPMLQFLNRTKSFYFLDVYPYFPWSSDPVNIKLEYALFKAENTTYTDPGSGLTYTNLFDQMVDAVIFAMKRLGYPDIRIWIAETGWPNSGDFDQIGCNIYNAATYNRNAVKKLTSEPPAGTPARPGRILPSFIFSLFNENQKPGVGTERNFGLLYPNGSKVYELDVSGETAESKYKPLPKPMNNEPYKGKMWCVVATGANRSEVGSPLSYACSQGNKTCDPIQPGGRCHKPDSVTWHASYAFSSYWAQFRKSGGTCYFNGLATQAVKDPSYGSCKFPSATL